MRDAEARERFSIALAVVFGVALISFLIYTIVAQRTDAPDEPPVRVGSHGPMAAVETRTGSAGQLPHQTTPALTASSSITTSVNNPHNVSSPTIAATNTRRTRVKGSGTHLPVASGVSLSSRTANLTCDSSAKPLLIMVSSILPVVRVASAISRCAS